jgi:hypothetical protein
MKATNEQRRQWAANAIAQAAGLPDSADRDTLLQIAKKHLQAIEQQGCRKPSTVEFAVTPSGTW